MNEPKWMTRARRYLGLRETPGKATTPTIARWLRELNAWWADDATPWCGVFVAAVMRNEGFKAPPHWYRARAWLNFGIGIEEPVPGCIAVFERGGAGHVGFVVGTDERGRLMILGGNQGDAVTIAPFDKSRVLGYRYPQGEKVLAGSLPLLASNGTPSSHNEA
jgi:uncharacterized protein (TIGR02594 family)